MTPAPAPAEAQEAAAMTLDLEALVARGYARVWRGKREGWCG